MVNDAVRRVNAVLTGSDSESSSRGGQAKAFNSAAAGLAARARRRRFHACLAALVVIAFVAKIGYDALPARRRVGEIVRHRDRGEFEWEPQQQYSLRKLGNETINVTVCRNTKQGPTWLADERGYACKMGDVMTDGSGCCETANVTELERYTCKSCEEEVGCCSVYEFCVTCCLDPSKVSTLKPLLKGSELITQEVIDPFELCSVLCRTSSKSVDHENRYRSPLKHCYTGSQPPMEGEDA